MSDEQVVAVSIANAAISTSVKPGTPLAFWVNEPTRRSRSRHPRRQRDPSRRPARSDPRRRRPRAAADRRSRLAERRALDAFGQRTSARSNPRRDGPRRLRARPFDAFDAPRGAIVIDPPVIDFRPVDPSSRIAWDVAWASLATLALLS
jgi:hypothetical protein